MNESLGNSEIEQMLGLNVKIEDFTQLSAKSLQRRKESPQKKIQPRFPQ